MLAHLFFFQIKVSYPLGNKYGHQEFPFVINLSFPHRAKEQFL